jgi:hypothetical protein
MNIPARRVHSLQATMEHIHVDMLSLATRWIFGSILPLDQEENSEDPAEGITADRMKPPTMVHICDNNDSLLPVAKPLFYDFPSYDRIGWELSSNGYMCPIPYATAAKVDVPYGFPEIPERWDAIVKESADGLYEVANVFEALKPTHKVEKAYRRALQKMELGHRTLYNEYSDSVSVSGEGNFQNEERRRSSVQICEDTTYEIEALIGLMQVFGRKNLDDVHGVERIGVIMTFINYSFEQNYNLNLVMTDWLRDHWLFPYADDYEVKRLTFKYGFNPLAVGSWLKNARMIVWKPLWKLKLVKYKDICHTDVPYRKRM